MLDVGRHPNIELLAYSEVLEVKGEEGDFKATIKRKARYVDEDKCTGCGACKEKCPTAIPDLFEEGLGTRRAIYSWFAQGIPSTHTIDPDHCRQLNGKKCGICAKVCQADAVNFDQKDRIIELDVGAIIVASGYDVFDPSRIPEYQYREIPNVVTSIEFERLLSASGPTGGHLDRPSDLAVEAEIETLKKTHGKSLKQLKKLEEKFSETSADFYAKFQKGDYEGDKDRKKWADNYEKHLAIEAPLLKLEARAEGFQTAKKLAFIQCVGSRDFRFYPFCSGYCCMHSIKEAIIAREHEPETTSSIFGMDIRAVGKGFEEYKVRGGDQSGITYVRSRVAEINEGPNRNPVLTYEDTREGIVKNETFDLVILATACAPSRGNPELAEILDIELSPFGFFKTDPTQPMDTTRPGIFTCGCAHSPIDIPESVAQASGAAARAARTVMKSDMRKAS